MRDKDISEIAPTLFPLAGGVVLTKADNPRSVEPNELSKLAANDPAGKVRVTDNVAEAIRIAREITAAEGVIVVTGSLYLVGEARKAIKDLFQI